MSTQTNYNIPKFTYSINMHDSDGDLYERGIYLHVGDLLSIRIGTSYLDFFEFVEHMQKIKMELQSELVNPKIPSMKELEIFTHLNAQDIKDYLEGKFSEKLKQSECDLNVGRIRITVEEMPSVVV